MFVDKAALTFEEAVPFFGKKGVVTGNPVRKEFFEISSSRSRAIESGLLIFGGSQGARAINNAMIDALPMLETQTPSRSRIRPAKPILKRYGRVCCGRLADARCAAVHLGYGCRSSRKADLIICRAGATTCAELAAAGKASIMVPLPTAADDHQRKNAEAMRTAGAAKMILQKDLTGEMPRERDQRD